MIGRYQFPPGTRRNLPGSSNEHRIDPGVDIFRDVAKGFVSFLRRRLRISLARRQSDEIHTNLEQTSCVSEASLKSGHFVAARIIVAIPGCAPAGDYKRWPLALLMKCSLVHA
jgi:hypothetical protein